jgi:MarR family transcriptional regulator, organic hydroperoxide resistance regulator
VSETATKKPAAGEKAERERQLTALGVAFREADRSLRRLRGRDTHLDPGEVGHSRFELIALLNDMGPMPAGELAAAAGVSAATVSQTVDRLEADGYAERVRSDADRRVVLVALSRQGQERLAEKRALWRKRWRRALAEVETGELEVAARVLARIGDVFADPDTPAR